MANSQNNTELDITKKVLVMYSTNPIIINPVQQAWDNDSTFKIIKREFGIQKFIEANKCEKVIFVIDTGKSCSCLHIEVAKIIQSNFPNSQRIATGENCFEPAKLRDYHSNACNIVQTYKELPEFIQVIKKIDSHQKTSS